MEKIGVFLSSKTHIAPELAEATLELGRWLGREGKTLVYGGSRAGQMERLAAAVKENGGRVFGVVPQAIVDRDLVSEHIDVEFRCAALADRKEIMLRESDAFVALPGGIGTLDEVFTVVAAHTFGLHAKPTILYDVAGYWDPLIRTLDAMKEQGFITGDFSQRLTVAHSFGELTDSLSR